MFGTIEKILRMMQRILSLQEDSQKSCYVHSTWYILPECMLRIIGCLPQREAPNQFRRFFSSTVMVLYICSSFYVLLFRPLEQSVLIKHVQFSTTITHCTMKIFLLFHYREDFFAIEDMMRSATLTPNNREKQMVKVPIFLKTVTFIYTMGATFSVFFVVLPPLFKYDLRDQFHTTFFFDVGQFWSIKYALSYIYHFIAVYITAALTNIDILIWFMMFIVCTQLKILNGRIRPALGQFFQINIERHFADFNIEIDDDVRILKKITIHHVAIIELTKKINKVFSSLVLINLLSVVIIQCFGIFFSIFMPFEVFEQGITTFIAICAYLQPFVYCKYGEDIKYESEKVCDICYESDWLSCNASMRRCLLLPMIRARTPLFLNIGPFYPLSLSFFLSLFQTSISYVLVLVEMTKEKKS